MLLPELLNHAYGELSALLTGNINIRVDPPAAVDPVSPGAGEVVAGHKGTTVDLGYPRMVLFFSLCDGRSRARVLHVAAPDFESAWQQGVTACQEWARHQALSIKWLRIDWVTRIQPMTWGRLTRQFRNTKRNYFRYGIALDAGFDIAFLEQELNANAMLYAGAEVAQASLNPKNVGVYARKRYGTEVPLDTGDNTPVFVFSTQGRFYADDPVLTALPGSRQQGIPLSGPGRNGGRRQIPSLHADDVFRLLTSASEFLARQVKASGEFVYGHFPCFGRNIANYNALRHASTTYAMLEAWELTGSESLKAAIDRSLAYLTQALIRPYVLGSGEAAAYLVDSGEEIKLGGNAVCLLALVKYTELTRDYRHQELMDALAVGIARMQNPETGQFVHVLHAGDLSVKQEFRIIYYDGEAAFGLMQLYGLTQNPRWLALVEKAFEYFLQAGHWQAHDHWLSYCVNELTRYRPEEKYFRFGVQNIAGYLDFIQHRITTYPTLLELSMAFQKMLSRLKQMPEMSHVLDGFDEEAFYRALHQRAHYLLNGFFWPEFAMYFARPESVLGSFFIRHHSFRVRIDDIEHYLSGYVAYWGLLRRQGGEVSPPASCSKPAVESVLLAWGGDVNLGRRQHYRTAELGAERVLDIPALKESHLSLVNLESVVTTRGEQGVDKGEGGPYYYRARPEMLAVLGQAGVDVVSTANNHSGDYGAAGLLDQQRWLAAAGMAQVGSGIDREAAFRPLVRQLGSLRLALMAVDATQHRFAATETKAGTAYLALEETEAWQQQMEQRIAKAREVADIVLVCVHWGDNHATQPSSAQIKAGHVLIDAGADAVLGSSAHRLQGVELYRQRPIIYDAGDLLFDAVRSSPKAGGIFQLELSKQGVERVIFIPVEVGFGHSWQAEGARAQEILSLLAERCRPFHSRLELCDNGTATLAVRSPQRTTRLAPRPAKVFRPAPALWISALEPAWTVKQVPAEARMEPVTLGPFTLLGLKSGPRWIAHRQMIWVESFWRIDAGVEEDWRLEVTAVPSWEEGTKPWGLGMDHDFCDWLLPTSRWCPGVVYRDFYGIRPPARKEWVNTELRLQLRLLTGAGSERGRVRLPVYFGLGLPEKPAMRWPFIQRSYRSDFSLLPPAREQTYAWDAAQLQAVTGGVWLTPPAHDWHVSSVVRGRSHAAMVKPPTLYVASTSLELARHEQYSNIANCYRRGWDSHRVLKALPRGVAGVIVSRPVAGLPEALPVLMVEDPVKALIELGIAARQRLSCPLVAVTGSAGKTTLVSMIRQLFSDRMEVHTTYDNYNSRVGIFAVMAGVPPSARLVALEVAVSAIDVRQYRNIKLLAPDVAVITNIGPAHLRGNEDTAAIAARKANLFRGVRRGGLAIVCRDTAHYDEIAARALAEGLVLISYGEHEQADCRLLTFDVDQSRALVAYQGHELEYPLGMAGRHFAVNSLVCLILARHLGLPLAAVAEGCAALKPVEGRGESLPLAIDGKRVMVVDDSYNANPLSMSAALQQLSALSHRGRALLLLGDMLELGRQAQQYHLELVPDIARCSPGKVYLVGSYMKAVAGRLREQGISCRWFEQVGPVMASLRQELQDGDLVLVKSSNGTRLSEVVAALKSLSAPSR